MSEQDLIMWFDACTLADVVPPDHPIETEFRLVMLAVMLAFPLFGVLILAIARVHRKAAQRSPEDARDDTW